jgi:hypothetical protein
MMGLRANAVLLIDAGAGGTATSCLHGPLPPGQKLLAMRAPVAVPSTNPRQGSGLTWVEVDLQKPHYLVWMLGGTLCLRFSTLDNKTCFSAPLGADAITFHLVPVEGSQEK